ncbi:hypothetical protein Tco_1356279, partial [Tanacetum coccineum]
MVVPWYNFVHVIEKLAFPGPNMGKKIQYNLWDICVSPLRDSQPVLSKTKVEECPKKFQCRFLPIGLIDNNK